MRGVLILLFLLPSLLQAQQFTNRGREFWVGYGNNYLFFAHGSGPASNGQEMILYLSAGDEAADVKVSITGTSWVRTYHVPANTAIPSDLIPKTGAEDCRLLSEGLYKKTIHIESDVPIVAYAHTYGDKSSGATLLLPVDSYAYTYYSLNPEQSYSEANAYFYVVAAEDNTRVRITPANTTVGGHAKGAPFEVELKRGEIYNVLGVMTASDRGVDLSGSKVQSIEGADGHCHPITLFSGSARTSICGDVWAGGDFIMQQVFPVAAWGTRYATVPTLTTDVNAAEKLNTNRYRVYVTDPFTKVYRNGVRISGLINTFYYEFVSNEPDYITADKPVMVAQFVPSQGGCSTTGLGDPEMFYLSPLEQAINKVTFYNTNKELIDSNFVSLVVPQSGLASLRIDGSAAFDYSAPHPNLPGYQVVGKVLPVTPGQHTVESSENFTSVTYGFGEYESYGYNAGCYVNNLLMIPALLNTGSSPEETDHVCPGSPFRLSIKTLYKAAILTWHMSDIPGINPVQDVVLINPIPDSTTVINGKTYYCYSLQDDYTLEAPGGYLVPVSLTASEIDNCSNTERIVVPVEVIPGPVIEFSIDMDKFCAGQIATVEDISPNQSALTNRLWTFEDGSTATTPIVNNLYETAGSYIVQLQATRTEDGCVGTIARQLDIQPVPEVAFTLPPVVCMPGGEALFSNQSALPAGNSAALSYQWDFGDQQGSAEAAPQHVYTSAGNYPVQLIVTSADGCADTLVQNLSAFANIPVAAFETDQPVLCKGQPAVFNDQSTADPAGSAITAWTWNWGDGTTGNTANPGHTYPSAGDYLVSLTVKTADGCVSEPVEQTVSIKAVPVVDAGPDMVTEPNRPVTLSGSVNDPLATIRWSPPAYLSATTMLTPSAAPPETQRYYLTATGEGDCMATDSVLVTVFKQLKVPNAFSPNGDGVNDQWIIPGLETYTSATVEIFNRWGQPVYRSVGYSRPWDGTRNGHALPVGAYYYIIQPKDNGYGTLKGVVMLLR